MSELIHKQMVAILRDVDHIGKTERNAAQGFNFRGIDQVFNELHGTFAKHGVYVRPMVIEHNHIERPTKSGGIALHHFVRVQFNFTAEDGSTAEMLGIGEAADNGDKGVAKCMSISMKYALLQAFLIPTQEEKDPDASATEWSGKKRRKGEDEPDPPGVQRNTPEQQAALVQQRIAEVKGESKMKADASSTVDFTVLKAFGEIKKHIGDDEYYEILDNFGYKKSNEIKSTDEARRIYKVMAARKKILDDAKEGAALLAEQPPPTKANASLRDA